ncbi:MAG TPA: type II secretion system F family protein, partial [Ignavibacteriales bacterium]|nr:type II secretion system F family protein [Ignavibacteriales bacterium]
SKSFAKHPEIFSDIYVANLRVAEESGQIAEVIEDYTKYLEGIQDLKRKIFQAARYPMIVLLVAGGVVFFMSFFLIPTFQGLFFSSKASLPGVTQFVLSVSYAIKDNFFIILGLLIAAFMLFLRRKKIAWINNLTDKMMIELPVISNLYIKNTLARFSLSMALLLKSKVSLLEALKISKGITGNRIFQKEIDAMIKRIAKGEALSFNAAKSRFFDMTYVKLLSAGEETAELEKVFYLISGYYSKEFDYQLDNATSLIEPALILFIGAVVGVILAAMYLPMFELINNFGV